MAICPKCGSNKFHYELRSAGTRSKSNYYKTGFDDNWVIPAGQKTYKSDRRQKAIGFCPNCGYVEDKQPQQKSGWFYLLCFVTWPISLCVWFYKTDLFRIDKKWRALIIVCAWAALLIWGAMLPPQ